MCSLKNEGMCMFYILPPPPQKISHCRMISMSIIIKVACKSRIKNDTQKRRIKFHIKKK